MKSDAAPTEVRMVGILRRWREVLENICGRHLKVLASQKNLPTFSVFIMHLKLFKLCILHNLFSVARYFQSHTEKP